MRAGRVSGQLCGRRTESDKEWISREAERTMVREHRRTDLATTYGEGYPTANSRHGKDEVSVRFRLKAPKGIACSESNLGAGIFYLEDWIRPFTKSNPNKSV